MSPCSTAQSFEEKSRIKVPAGPGMQIFSPDGKYGYVCSSFNPETVVITVADHQIVGHVKQDSPFCPNIAATPDGKQVWFTLKDIGKTEVFDAQPPFSVLKTIDTGPITNHVNIVHNANGTFAYVTVGGLNEVKVFRTDDFSQVATIPVGKLPHGIWPSGDGSRVYVGLENADGMAAIDTADQQGDRDQPDRPGAAGHRLCSERGAGRRRDARPAAARRCRRGRASRCWSGRPAVKQRRDSARQGADQCLAVRSGPDAGAAGLGHGPRAEDSPTFWRCRASGRRQGPLEPLAAFMTNPAGSAIVNATGAIRQIVQGEDRIQRRYLVIAEGHADKPGACRAGAG